MKQKLFEPQMTMIIMLPKLIDFGLNKVLVKKIRE